MSDEHPQAAETTPLGTLIAPDGDGAPVPAPAGDEDGSLAAHEAAHGRAPVSDDTRAPDGRFKRRRAASQQAEPDDVPLIHEYTKRLKAAEETAGKDIARKPGESERVYTLRRRAELAERLAAPPKAVEPPAPALQPAPVALQARQPLPATFPAYEAFIAIAGNEGVDYDTYRDIREDWAYQRRRELERQQETAAREAQTAAERAAAHLARLPDRKSVV